MSSKELYRKVVRWADLPTEHVREGVRRSGYITDDVMLVMNYVEPGMALNPHVHDDFDQLAYIVSGRANYYIDGVAHELTAGSMLLVPAGSPHYIEPLEEPCLNLDIFVPPRDDLMHLDAQHKTIEYAPGAGEAS
ncbi:cupin domain-containing protein [Streptomyces acidicola]|uniref:cupin domain-containing protein n=1 Tax=Streptomyces acidicola TaxID=2596892 RepID=UPI003447D460